jgi:membrane protein YdbS with pleckstrin-like domain
MPPLNPDPNATLDPAPAATPAATASLMPNPTGRKCDKDGYYRLGKTTLYFLFLKYGFPAILLFILELILLGAAAGGNALPPFSQWVSQSAGFAEGVRYAAEIVPVLILIAIIFAAAMALTFYYSFRYKIENNDLSFERGILGIQEISLPFRQIQNADLEQTILYRIFNLADLIILTAGHEDPTHVTKDESEIIMPALNIDEARRLQHFLLERANIQRVVAENPSIEPPVPPPLN